MDLAHQRRDAGGNPGTSSTAAVRTERRQRIYFALPRKKRPVFPGDWAPLRGKKCENLVRPRKSMTIPRMPVPNAHRVHKISAGKKLQGTGGENAAAAGIVVIFRFRRRRHDRRHHGHAAAMASGRAIGFALWHRCFFDPPETFDSPASSASQLAGSAALAEASEPVNSLV